jgi:hypothetical protein
VGVVMQRLAAPAGYLAAVAAVGDSLSIRCSGVERRRALREDGRTMHIEAMLPIHFWAYPEGVSWAGSRPSLPYSATT